MPEDKTNKFDLIIFYQSLEYNDNFTKKLAGKLSNHSKKFFSPLQSRASGDNEESYREYHKAVKEFLTTYISDLKDEYKPDIIALGEYTPEPEFHKIYKEFLKIGNTTYNLAGFVKTKKPTIVEILLSSICISSDANWGNYDGTRGMTILYRNGCPNIHRITIHNEEGSDPDVWHNRGDELLENAYGKKRYTQARNKMREKWRGVAKNIGPCAEIMFRNRYFSIGHIKENCEALNKKKGAVNNALASMYLLPHIRIAGDCNFNLNKKKYEDHFVETTIEKWKAIANTNSSNLFKNSIIQSIQDLTNLPGHTSSAKKATAHDGYYDYINPINSEKVEIIGSFWPILIDESKKEYPIISDHKGFLLKLTTESQTDSDTISIKTNASLKDSLLNDENSMLEVIDKISQLIGEDKNKTASFLEKTWRFLFALHYVYQKNEENKIKLNFEELKPIKDYFFENENCKLNDCFSHSYENFPHSLSMSIEDAYNYISKLSKHILPILNKDNLEKQDIKEEISRFISYFIKETGTLKRVLEEDDQPTHENQEKKAKRNT